MDTKGELEAIEYEEKLLTLAAVLAAACLVFCEAAYGTAEQNMQTFPKHGVPVLMYHSISSKYDNSICVYEKQAAYD